MRPEHPVRRVPRWPPLHVLYDSRRISQVIQISVLPYSVLLLLARLPVQPICQHLINQGGPKCEERKNLIMRNSPGKVS